MNNVSSSNSQKALVPELRFPEFREEWKKEKLSDFVVRVTRKNKDNQSNLPLTISSKDGLVDQVTYFNKKVSSKDMSGYYLLKNGEFAYNRSYSVGYDFGSIKRLDMYDEGALSTLYICFALKKHNSDFIKTYFDSLKWYKEIYMIAAEGARNHGLLNVPTEDFFDTIHTLPKSIDEQTKIADFLTLLEQRILKQEKLVNALKLYKRGVENTLFDEIEAQSCEYIGIDNAVDSIPTSKHQIPSSEYKSDGLYPVIDQGKRKIVAYSDDSIKLYYDIPAIIYGDHTTNIKYMDTPFILGGDGTKLLKPRNNANIKYLYYALAHYNVVQEGYKRHFPILKTKLIPVPNNDTQIVVSSVLSVIDNKIEANESLLDKFSLLKKSFLQKMFI
ncbi:hypothetical protein [uncultured Solobacterium sp.]|uniref:hypothetical protein n=1 Tax=uncultured Solobacterium sp. TaxID=747375 RepID=UPI0028E61D5D|nr:hypothetical protein [uncultured Solobacterium sp.]